MWPIGPFEAVGSPILLLKDREGRHWLLRIDVFGFRSDLVTERNSLVQYR